MTSHLERPPLSRSGASVHSTENDEFAAQHEENPLDVGPSSFHNQSIPRRPVPSAPQRRDTLQLDTDEPPPPYQELEDGAPENGVQIAPIEYSVDNSPQLSVPPELEYMEVSARSSNHTTSQAPELNPVQSEQSPAFNDPSLVPTLPPIQSGSSSNSVHRVPGNHGSQPSPFSSAKAREAGFDLESPSSTERTASSSSLPRVTISTDPLTFTREAGKITAYLIPFPKPRIKGINPEDIPNRFMIYTPPAAPLSKPAPGEKESHWHKSQRQWQEDVRKATMKKASAATWKGMKARTTTLIHKGVNITRSTNVEFLDRVSGGAITSTEDAEAHEPNQITDAGLSSEPSSLHSPTTETTPSTHMSRTASVATTTSSNSDKGKAKNKPTKPQPQPLSHITLIYPPSLALTPDQIRTEFLAALLRTHEKSRKDAVIASTLLPFAAAIDASLIVTLGGLTQISGVWAYTSTRGAMASRKISKGLVRNEEYALARAEHPEDDSEECEVVTRGCTCGHHEDTFGAPTTTVKTPSAKEQYKKKGISLHLQQSTHLEVLRRYLDLACLKKEFHMFPTIEEAAGDVGEGTVLGAIGWKPVRRQGRDLEVEFKDGLRTMTSEEDEMYQLVEAREDVKRYFRKGAGEWVAWCRAFGKDPEGVGKK